MGWNKIVIHGLMKVLKRHFQHDLYLHSGTLTEGAKGHTWLRQSIFSLPSTFYMTIFMNVQQMYINKYKFDTKRVIFDLSNWPTCKGARCQHTLATCQSQTSLVLDFLSDKCDRQSNSTRNIFDLYSFLLIKFVQTWNKKRLWPCRCGTQMLTSFF